MYHDGYEFYFVHRTLANFLVAKYFYDVIFDQKYRAHDELGAVIRTFLMILDESFKIKGDIQMIFIFLEDAVKKFEFPLLTRRMKNIKIPN